MFVAAGNSQFRSDAVTDSNEIHHLAEAWSHGYTSPRRSVEPDLTDQVVAADEQTSSQVDLALTWRELIQGSSIVIGSFFSSARCGLLLSSSHPRERSLSGRRLEILESVLCGVGQNCVAIDLNLAPSTVALNARQALESLGVSGRPSRVHPLLMLAAKAGRERTLASGSLSFVSTPFGEVQVIGIPRPGRRLLGVVPAAELEVISLLIEGCCYAEIAKRRGTAERTIANQIAAVFKRLNVSGRSDLIQRLFELDGIAARPAPDTTPPPPPSVLPPPTVRYPRPAQAPVNEARISGIRPMVNPGAALQFAGAARGS
jgi:DNA-binding NarL/FixJ family response regulator